MKRSRAARPKTTAIILLITAVILLPLGLTIAWGEHFATGSYTLFIYARDLADGAGLIPNAVGNFPAPPLNSVVFGLLLSLPAKIGIEPSRVAWILSAAGWSAAALAILAIGQSINRLQGAIVSALLLCFSPSIIGTIGSPTSWIIAWGWITLALIVRRRHVFAVLTSLFFMALLIPWPSGNLLWQLNQHLLAAGWTLFLFLAGVGIDWSVGELARRDQTVLPVHQIRSWLLAAIFTILAVWQATRIWQAFQERPERYWRLEEDVASWLQLNSDPSSLLLANSRIGYLSQRPTATTPNWPTIESTATMQNSLQADPADYLVTTNEFSWQQLKELNWFRLSYEPLEQFNDLSIPEAPMTIWSYREPIFESNRRQTVNARIPDRLSILGYQVEPQQVQPGETVQMILYLQAPEATALAPVPFRAIVRLVSPIDGRTISDWEFDLPRSIALSAWQAGDVITEQLPLEIPTTLETGAYQFNISFIGADNPEMWPISLDKDINRLDRIALGGIIVPEEGATENPLPIDVTFDEAIKLTGYTINEPEPGKMLEVNLFWEAGQEIDEEYTVFLHLLDNDGELVASHDGQPDNGRFPTSFWLPGITIPDRHAIQWADDLAPGEYDLKVGLYDAQTGQRLPASTATTEAPANNAVPLTKVIVP